MAIPRVKSAGGIPAIRYVWAQSRHAGGFFKLYKRLRSRNACKTCAVGMGGTRGGMVNEAGHFPEVCKKSVQAQAADMAGGLSEEWVATTSVSELERLSAVELERLGRITFPMRLRPGDKYFRRIAWEQAFELTAEALKRTAPNRTFFYASGRSSNEAAFLFGLVARAYGTQNVNNCSYYCHHASSVALSQVYGSGTASVVLDDLGKADLVVVAGANPASNHPRLVTQLVNLRRRGGKVIVVNPLRELGLVRFRIPSDARSFLFGSQVSDLYLQPHIGGDLALYVALLKRLIECAGVDTAFVAQHTSGWEAVAQEAASADWAELEAQSGVSRVQIDAAADLLRSARLGVFCWAMGLTQQPHGTDTIVALANLALARGFLGRPGTGLLPIRGHSNVQGVGSVGVAPQLKAGFQAALEKLYGIPSSLPAGQDTYASMTAAERGEVDVAMFLGGNLLAANPDSAWAARAMQNIGTSVYLSTKLNLGHIHGRGRTTLVLPVLARDEENQSTSQESMFNFVRLSEGGTPAVPGEMRSEVDIISELARRILPEGRFDWSELSSHAALRQAMARVVPGYAPMAGLDSGGGEFQIQGRTLHAPAFPTPDGKAHFHITPRPKSPHSGMLRLMTLRSEGQFNTVVYEEEDLYRGNLRRDVVMMSDADARDLQLSEGERVIVQTKTGQMAASVAVVDIRPGNLAMYYPEANILVPREIDPQSKTPAFKYMLARILPLRVGAQRHALTGAR